MFFCGVSTSFTMLLLKNCRRSIASSPAWHRAPALTVESCRLGWFSSQLTPFMSVNIPAPLLLLFFSAFTDSTQKDLLKLIGNLPVRYEGESQLGPHRRREVLSVQCSDHSSFVPRPHVQHPCAAVADGLVPLHSTHLLLEADVQHGHQGGQARRRPGEDLPARVAKLGLCRVYRKIRRAKLLVHPVDITFFVLLYSSQSRLWLVFCTRWLPSLRRLHRFLRKPQWRIKTRMSFWLLSTICRSTTVLHQTWSQQRV